MNNRVKQIVRFLISLKFGIILLIIIALYSVIGTVLPQHMPDEIYMQRYPSYGQLILALSLNRVYSSVIFTSMLVLFGLNLLGCTVKSLRGQLKQARKGFFPKTAVIGEQVENSPDQADALAYFKYRKYQVEKHDQGFRAAKFRWGVLGPAVTHAGIIFVLAAGIISSAASREGFVNLLPGQEVTLDERGIALRLDDFYMTFLENGAVEQYFSDLTVSSGPDDQRSETIWVNRPMQYRGINFYQASYGWVSSLVISDAETGETLAQRQMQDGQDFFFQPGHLTVVLYGYFPELAIGHNQEPVSLSHREKNPHYGVVLYEFNRLAGTYIIGPGEVLRHGDWEITFSHSTLYTGILFRSDPSYPVALIGFIVLMLGMLISFYFFPRFAEYSDGALHTWSRKNGWVFHRTVSRHLDQS